MCPLVPRFVLSSRVSLSSGALTSLVAGLLIFSSAVFAAAQSPAFVWIEGEQPTRENVPSQKDSSGRPDWLSGGAWLHYSVEANNVDKELPQGGAQFSYEFKADQPGAYQVWARLGYETGESPFDWHVDAGEWQRTLPHLIDGVELQFFNEVGWQHLGAQTLTAGRHQLEIRLPRTVDKNGKARRILYGLDALCLTTGKFIPNGKFKPNEDGLNDRDRAADQFVFNAPAVTADHRQTSLPLQGQWEVCRFDEDVPGPVDEPITGMPDAPHWTAIQVPGDKAEVRPDLRFAHRLWYRTHINIPAASQAGSFYLVFPLNSLNTTVVVNGTLCGFSRNPLARAQIDITKAVKAGQVNELRVGIRDAYYGYYPTVLRSHFFVPAKFFGDGFQEMDYPVAGHPESGILLTPELVTTGGPAYVSDVFCKPSVARKALEVEATVTLPGGTSSSAAGELSCEAIDQATGQSAKRWEPQSCSLAGAGGFKNLSLPWADAKLWWPDNPQMYRLRITLRIEGKVVDMQETPFGFREWAIEGTQIKLNGVPYHAWADIHSEPTKEAWLDFHRKSHQTMFRLWGWSWKGMNLSDALDWFDHQGIVLRYTGITDGENMNYHGYTEAFARNYREQLYQWIRGERNHPSIFCWSAENEMTYINSINAGWADRWELVTAQAWRDVSAGIDPTRLFMTDGGGAGQAQALPVQGDHYVAGDWPKYPNLAYQPNITGGGRDRWWWDMKRPRIIGEDYFYEGNHPELAYFGGENAFTGKAGTLHASALAESILEQGYRWANYAGWQFWIDPASGDGSQYNSFSQRAVFCRQWDWTFGSGQKAKRAFAIFNDTEHPDPLTFTWTLSTAAGQALATGTTVHQVAPGTHEIFDVVLPMPATAVRLEGELTLTLSAQGETIFTDKKAISILAGARDPRLAKLGESELAVYDPKGGAANFLKAEGVRFTALASLDQLPAQAKILLIGQDAITPTMATDTRLAAYALDGHRLIALEQENPLKYQAVPSEMESSKNEGRTGFPEDLNHPVFAGLAPKDFFTWSTGALTATELSRPTVPPPGNPYPVRGAQTAAPIAAVLAPPDDEIVYRNAYGKPVTGGRSLFECDELLHDSGLVEVPVGRGLLLLSQLAIEEKLGANATAQTLCNNLIAYAAADRLEDNSVAAAVDDLPPLARALGATGLEYIKVADPIAAISGKEQVAIISATPAHLKVLSAHLDEVRKFTAAGGSIVFNGLTPEGLADYNKIVGYEHIIRPYRRERILFPAVRDPLTAGLTAADVVMYSSQRIFSFMEGNYVDEGEFDYVVDLDEIAPFAKSTFGAYDKIVNGFTSADGWPLIINFPVKAGQPFTIPITLPRPETVTGFTWVGNSLYNTATRIALLFDGKDPQTFDVHGNQAIAFAIDPPRPAREVTLQILDWEKNKVQPDGSVLTGIDNIYLKVQRPAGFAERVKGMLNVGAMVDYPQGKGRIVLCNLAFKDAESVPENSLKKQTVLAKLLRNLHAPFAGGQTIIAGAHLKYYPIDLSRQATAYRDEKGWLGDKNFTFRDIPTGSETFAHVKYDVYDFPTSPVPTVIILLGKNAPPGVPTQVRGIPVNRKADALFFLQAARLDSRRTADELKKHVQYELFDYVIHYADGQEIKVPIWAEVDVENYKQPGAPLAIPGAAVAWSAPYGSTGFTAVAYAKQWSNPRPDVPIQSIDVTPGPDQARGVPAVVAITAASIEH